jgi:nicotinamidase/pyrazinamidase
MSSSNVVLWEVDTQADFMLPSGKLYVPGAEKFLPKLRQLTDAAREGRAFLVSHGCFHAPNDPEFAQFPPHCVRGTAGAEFVPEALTDKVLRVPNDLAFRLPGDFSACQQVLMEKQTFDIFETCHAEEVVNRFDRHVEFAVFGVVTEICVVRAARGLLNRGRRVALVTDAIETLKPEDGQRTVSELRQLGARLTTTAEVLATLNGS